MSTTKSKDNGKYDIMMHENLKFLLYRYNGFLDRNFRPIEQVRHTFILENIVSLKIQWGNWHHYIEETFSISKNGGYKIDGKVDLGDLRMDVLNNVQIVQVQNSGCTTIFIM